jgi:hypothetical protein
VIDTDSFPAFWWCKSRPRRYSKVSFRRFTVVIFKSGGGAVQGIAGEGGYFNFIQGRILMEENVTGHAQRSK